MRPGVPLVGNPATVKFSITTLIRAMLGTVTMGSPSPFRFAGDNSTPVSNVTFRVTLHTTDTYATSLREFNPATIPFILTWRIFGLPLVTFTSTCAAYPRTLPDPNLRSNSSSVFDE